MRRRSADQVHYSEEAENDLFEIGVYTWTEWGEEQFMKYMSLLRETCEDIIPHKYRLARSVPKRPELPAMALRATRDLFPQGG